ncbi:MAG: DUF1016 N-terminal domain-containing protein [Olsenella profusa]
MSPLGRKQRHGTQQLALYYSIDRHISANTRTGTWGTGAIEAIGSQLQEELSGLRGFSARNLKCMRTLYEEWSQGAEDNSALVNAEFECRGKWQFSGNWFHAPPHQHLIVGEKATMVVDHIEYHAIDDSYDYSIFTERKYEPWRGRTIQAGHKPGGNVLRLPASTC